MNVYEQAHRLSDAIKESEEFKQFDENKKRVESNPQLYSAITDFLQKQMQMQTSQMMGQQIDNETFMELQRLSAVLMQDPVAAQYLQTQMRFSIMMADVYKILADVSDMGVGSPVDLAKKSL